MEPIEAILRGYPDPPLSVSCHRHDLSFVPTLDEALIEEYRRCRQSTIGTPYPDPTIDIGKAIRAQDPSDSTIIPVVEEVALGEQSTGDIYLLQQVTMIEDNPREGG
jgi:hypothetical protein